MTAYGGFDREVFGGRGRTGARMDPSTLAADVESALAVSPEAFRERVRDDADRLLAEIRDGTFDNPQAITGLEYELYAVDAAGEDPGGHLARVPRRLLEYIGFEKELGLHNAEVSTSPLPLNADGLAAQEAAVSAQLRAATTCVEAEGLGLVSDGIWTIPPEDETAYGYLTDVREVDGLRLAENMSASPRYHAMANATSASQPAMRVDLPHATLEASTVMPESLITSVQPHYQVPAAQALPTRFRYALRIAGPLVALGANSPFLPPDLYEDAPPGEIIEETWVEQRIPIFESVLNPEAGDGGLVAFPRDFETVEEAIERIATDDVLVPLEPEETGRFDDRFAAFRMKHGTHWRWVRPVFDGATRSAANARLEFRPLSAQPTIRGSIAFLAAFAGLMEALPANDHPIAALPWDRAEANFYAAARSGFDADLVWITADGIETTDREVMYRDLLDHAAEGLRISGLTEEEIGRYLGPLRRRVRYGTTPAGWKCQQVQRHLGAGKPLAAAIHAMQREYLERQAATLFDDDFSAWLEADRYAVGPG